MTFSYRFNFFLSLFWLSASLFAQHDTSKPPEDVVPCYRTSAGEEPVFTIVEQMPAFPGGDRAMFQYLWENLRYPSLARASGTQGTVYLCFLVSEEGVLSHIMVKRGLPNGCSEEAVRLVQAMPRWTPGRQQGRRVKTIFTLPVRFILDAPTPKRAFETIPASGEIVFLEKVFFERDTAQLRPESYTMLIDLKDMLEKDTTLKIDIYGYCNDTSEGVQKINRSKVYAKTVYDYLIRAKISKNRLSYHGFEGNTQNARVAFRIPVKVVPYVKDSLKCTHATCQISAKRLSTKAAFSTDPKALAQYLDTHLKYPVELLENGIEGTVYLAFRVANDGSLQNIQVKRGVSGGCTEEAIRVVQGMPKWIPATKKGKNVCSEYTLPVKLKIY